MKSTRDNVTNMRTKYLLEIRDNQYRSRDGLIDYDPEAIDFELYMRQSKSDERYQKKLIKEREEAEYLLNKGY